MVKLLVASGAEVDCKDKKAYTPLHAAASSGMSSTVHYLLGLGVQVGEARSATLPANTPSLSRSHSLPPLPFSHPPWLQVNEVNSYGNTPLHLACYNGQDVVVGELIEAGANVNQVRLRRQRRLALQCVCVCFIMTPLSSSSGQREGFLAAPLCLLLTPGGAVPGAAADTRRSHQHAGERTQHAGVRVEPHTHRLHCRRRVRRTVHTHTHTH